MSHAHPNPEDALERLVWRGLPADHLRQAAARRAAGRGGAQPGARHPGVTVASGDSRGHSHGHAHGAGGHRHGQGHGHTHGTVDPALLSTAQGISAVKWSLAILGATAAIQVAVVLLAGSVALLADAVHNVGDALTAVPLWIAFSYSRRPPTRRYTYGFGRIEDLAGIAVVLTVHLTTAVGLGEGVWRRIPSTSRPVGQRFPSPDHAGHSTSAGLARTRVLTTNAEATRDPCAASRRRTDGVHRQGSGD